MLPWNGKMLGSIYFTMKDMKSGFGFWVLGFELMKLTIFLFFVTENLCIRPNVFYHEGQMGQRFWVLGFGFWVLSFELRGLWLMAGKLLENKILGIGGCVIGISP